LSPTERLKVYKDILDEKLNEQKDAYQECQETTDNNECQSIITSYEELLKTKHLVEERLKEAGEGNE